MPAMSPLHAIRASLVAASRRYSRVAHEVEDLAHDIVLSAVRRGMPLDDLTFVRSVDGAARRHGAFLARSAVRRRARELRTDLEPVDTVEIAIEGEESGGASPSTLSPALRTTLLLLVQGLDKAELRHVLGLTDAALRKRFQALRDHAPLARPALPAPSPSPGRAGLRRAQIGLLRQLVGLPGEGAAGEGVAGRRVLAASDPDGHGLFFAEVLTPGGPAATTSRSDPDAPRTARESSGGEAPC